MAKLLESLCRLCLKESHHLEDIFEDSEASSMAMRIMASVSLEVHKNDNLPKRVCPPCRYQLEKSYVFRSRCRNNDTRLRRHVKLLAAGKPSSLLAEEEEEDEDEFEQSLEYIRMMDDFREEDRSKQWQEKVSALEQDFQAMSEIQRSVMYDEVKEELAANRLAGLVDVGVMTEAHRSEPEKVIAASSKQLGSHSRDTKASPAGSVQTTKNKLRARIHAKLAKEDDALVEMLQTNELMEIDDTTNGNDSQSIEILEDSLPSNSSEGLQRTILQAGPEEQFIITEVSDSETYVLDNEELRKEEDQLYGTVEDSDDDLEVVTNAVKAELAGRPNLKVGDDCMMRVEKDRDRTKVEVQATDGSVICMEFSTELNRKEMLIPGTLLSCPICDLSFKTEKSLETHVNKHNTKSFACEICLKLFPSQSSLHRHFRAHTGEKPFACDLCDKRFVQKEILKRHMIIHSEDKPFVCEICDKRFNQKNQLRHHLNMVHTANPVIESHQCHICTKTFRYPSGLSRHVAAHYGRMYVCHCGRSFTDQSAFKRHETAVHKKAD